MHKKILVGIFTFSLFSGLFFAMPTFAAGSLSMTTSNLSLSESPLSGNFKREFNLLLSPAPTSEVTTTFSTDGNCVLGHANKGFTTGGAVVTQNDSLHFGIQAIDDSEYEGLHTCEVSFSAISTTDLEYATAVTRNYSFSVSDNDIEITPTYTVTALSSARMQEGSPIVESYEVGVSQPPEDPIVITAIADEQCDLLQDSGDNQVRVRTISATIKGGSAGTAQFTIIPREDGEFEGIHQCAIQHTASTDDLTFSGLTVPAYFTNIADNDANPDIPDDREYEGGLIYYKDANYDGIDDTEQPQVTSFLNAMHGKRQGLVIVDSKGTLLEGCQFTDGVQSKSYDETDSSYIVSSQGSVIGRVQCDASQQYYLMWILDQYYPEAPLWGVYQEQADSLTPIQTRHIIYNLGDDFTSALILSVEQSGSFTLLQSQSSGLMPAQLDQDYDSPAAAVAESRASSMVIVGVGLAAIVGFVLWRRYLKLYDSKKTVAPDIDRF